MELSQKTIDIVKSTAVPITFNAETIVLRMFEVLFEKYPEVEKLFRDKAPDYHTKLASMIAVYATNIDDIEILREDIKKVAVIHVKRKVLPEHYPLVGSSLIFAIKDVLGNIATDEMLEAWREAYFFLADTLIKYEKELYSS